MFSLANGYCSIYFSVPTVTVLVVGLDSSGKTTFVEAAKSFYRCKSIRIPLDRIRPTTGLNVTKMEGAGAGSGRSGCTAVLWDAGGQASMRCHWQRYYDDVDGIVFVVDGTDGGRLEEAGVVFGVVRNDERVAGIPICLFVNKQDRAGPVAISEVASSLSIDGPDDNGIFVMGGSAWDGDGVQEALDWVVGAARDARAGGTSR